MSAAAFGSADVDDLIGSLQSVYAGDRGCALRDLRSTLYSSLGSVALGPSHPEQRSPHHLATPGPSPSPPPGTSTPWSLLPPAALSTSADTPGPSSPQARHPPSPVLSVVSHPARSSHSHRARAAPYASRPKSREAAGSMSASASVSRSTTRHASPEHPVAAALAELNHSQGTYARRPVPSRTNSAASTLSVGTAPLASPRSLTASPPSPFEAVRPGPSRLSPAWKHSLALTPMPPQSPSMSSAETYATSTATSTATTALDSPDMEEDVKDKTPSPLVLNNEAIPFA